MVVLRSASLSVAIHGEQYLTELLNHGRQPSTIKTYRDRLKWFEEWRVSIGVPLSEITRDTVEQWISDMRTQGYSPKHVRENVGVLRWFFAWLEDREFLPRDPLRRMMPVKVPKRLPQILDVQVILALVAAASTTRERAIFELLYGAGLRRSELLGVDLEHLNLPGLNILIRGKGDKERLQPITQAAAGAIEGYLAERGPSPETALLLATGGTRKGKRLGRTGLTSIIKGVAIRAGIHRRVYAHLFRHCYATHLLAGGARLEEVQELMGHENISTTRIYTHLSTARLADVVKRAHPRG